MSGYLSASVDVSGTHRCCSSSLSSDKVQHPTRFEPPMSHLFAPCFSLSITWLAVSRV